MSMLFGDNAANYSNINTYEGCFLNLFSNCTTIISAYDLQLPATTLSS